MKKIPAPILAFLLACFLLLAFSPFAISAGDPDLEFDELDELDEQPMPGIADPLETWNRAMFTFNDKLYFWVMKPVARGYRAVLPKTVRIGVRNFFTNLTTPIRFVNCLLQGKGKAAADEFGRFMFNSTMGLLGFVDIVKKSGGPLPAEEDLGQTLGVYGMGHGIYLNWPFLGPSSLRDSFGFAGDLLLDPVTYINPLGFSLGVRAYDELNSTSLTIGDYESLKEAALDPYTAVRDAYLQYRHKKLEE